MDSQDRSPWRKQPLCCRSDQVFQQKTDSYVHDPHAARLSGTTREPKSDTRIRLNTVLFTGTEGRQETTGESWESQRTIWQGSSVTPELKRGLVMVLICHRWRRGLRRGCPQLWHWQLISVQEREKGPFLHPFPLMISDKGKSAPAIHHFCFYCTFNC